MSEALLGLAILAFFVLVLVAWLAIMVLVYRDANARGRSGLLWAAGIFCFGVFALAPYLLVTRTGGDGG